MERPTERTKHTLNITVAYDARPLQPQTRHWGPGVVLQNVLDKLPEEFWPIGLAHKFPAPEQRHIEMWPAIPKLQQLFFEISPLLLRNWDVYWGTNHVLPQMARGPSVVTVHDLLILRYPEDRHWPHFLVQRFISSIRRASKLVADSKATADDLLAHFPELGAKLEVAHLGFDSSRMPLPAPVDNRRYSDVPYVVMLGCHHPRKNLGLALAAVRQARQGGSEIRLVITNDMHPSFRPLLGVGSQWVQYLGIIPKEEIFALLRGAVALLFPSRYEGFGLPMLEAMAGGCPVLALNTPINREIGGDAAWLLSDEPEDWSAAMRTLSGTPSKVTEMRERGFMNLRRFSWDKTASVYSEIFKETAR